MATSYVPGSRNRMSSRRCRWAPPWARLEIRYRMRRFKRNWAPTLARRANRRTDGDVRGLARTRDDDQRPPRPPRSHDPSVDASPRNLTRFRRDGTVAATALPARFDGVDGLL